MSSNLIGDGRLLFLFLPRHAIIVDKRNTISTRCWKPTDRCRMQIWQHVFDCKHQEVSGWSVCTAALHASAYVPCGPQSTCRTRQQTMHVAVVGYERTVWNDPQQ
jgi:hypothetical protein